VVTALYSHPDFAGHLTPAGHPEQVARMAAVARGLAELTLDRRDCPMGDLADVLRCHTKAYVDGVIGAVPAQGVVALDADTFLSAGSYGAAMRAVGGACAAVDAVLAGAVRNAFLACRPPGHHAEQDRAMGFCLFGTVGIAARRALDVHGLTRVAIVDFDVHHGNGTQDLIWFEERCLFVSSHQAQLWPGTGWPSHRGEHGQVLNLTLPKGSDGAAMRALYEAEVLPRVAAHRPELILVSAGFDAHRDDPLAGLNWVEADYAWLTGAICDVADECCGGRVVSCLEGGYDLDALASSVAAHVGVLEERGR
jgi:acetoin utilization deacetylase AcuC-like enzyme